MKGIVVIGLVFAGCGFSIDAGSVEVPPNCGDGIVDADEECDNGTRATDAICDPTCQFTCGNGNVEVAQGEQCDTAIASGTGMCPTACDDGIACTSDTLSGSDCTAACVNEPITEAAFGDGCCPAGANANNDDDCAAGCGNGVLEDAEMCDSAITSGPGRCPTSCDDNQACTVDTLTGSACQAHCVNTTITAATDGDGCCPAGANNNTDDDCSATCGNSALEAGETCDTGFGSNSPNACPTSCNDNVVCTNDQLLSAGTCDAVCSFTAITMPINGDGCCPPGANATNDDSCVAMCGNGVREGTEECDDGNTSATDACRNDCTFAPAAFRFADLALRDPHFYVSDSLIPFSCRDVTDSLFGEYSYNSSLEALITGDTSPMDGKLDLSPTLVFRPLNQGNGAVTAVQFYIADCTSPLQGTMCMPGGTAPVTLAVTSQNAGTCLAPIAGTTRPYTPAVTAATGKCFASAPTTLNLTLGGVPLTMTEVRFAATYSGSPASSLLNGVLMGFVSEASADTANISSSVSTIGGHKLSYLLPGGDPGGPEVNCAAHDDRDMSGTTRGWYFYFNFTAPRTTWTDP